MKKYIAIASFSGALAVMLGAFGAHALKKILSVSELNSFETGVRYQMIHSLLLLIVMLIPMITEHQKKRIAKFLIFGVVCFSGSIYLLTLGVVPSKYIWFVTPLGGLLLLASWIMIGIDVLKQKTTL
ncbi:DUF423 domain-containing protein [Wenyingzhuangia sp. chi5]|uniref:DUF423 domain-containing protein n=1 Tax=Wenyingzhuangia gilva TaxID=3057677 RepID=A0ABT8VR76_9FLAO|nr:DUF423 domain-containing protein [Wenyingzhuangia sp. chi5]MDO3694474.1 DUF423 domain-containing protein [Wenyingzhuangia sp. chi5]